MKDAIDLHMCCGTQWRGTVMASVLIGRVLPTNAYRFGGVVIVTFVRLSSGAVACVPLSPVCMVGVAYVLAPGHAWLNSM